MVNDIILSARALREKYQADPHRPGYHFLPPEGVCHPADPQACIFWEGRYHFLYGCQIDEVGVWAHASSVDLLHWRHHPVPLGIAPEDPEDQVYAGGSLINKEGVPTIIYHGTNAGTCIATSTDEELIHWHKHPANPIIPEPKEGDANYGAYHVWDVCGWVDGDTYYAITGNKPYSADTQGDIAWLFKSDDLINWKYLHPFYQSERRWTNDDEDCSCADFFPLGDKHVLMFISHTQGLQYYIGSYQDERFYPEHHGRMNWPGGPCYAQESLIDDKGRRIFWAWVCESVSMDVQRERGWSGVMSLPRVLSLAEDGTLLIEPAAELKALRLNHRQYEDIELDAGSGRLLDDVKGACLELKLEVEPPTAGVFGLKVRCAPNGEEQTAITFDRATGKLSIDTSRSTLSDKVAQPWPDPYFSYFLERPEGRTDVRVQQAPLTLLTGEPLRLQIFLDRSILEVFANGRQCMTQRIYPTRSDSLGVSLFSSSAHSVVMRLDAWDMAATNPW